VTISGLQFQNIGASANAIYIYNSSNVTITANDFDNDVSAIYCQLSTNVRVTWNRYRNLGDGSIGSGHSNFVQFNGCTDGYIANNKGKGGNMEDIISIAANSGGSSAASPLIIENNQFQGQCPDGSCVGYTSDSGSGMMLGDAGGQHIIARFNTLLNTGQVGIGIPSGTDVHVTDNVVYGEQGPASNIGIYVWNQYSTPCSGIEIARNQVKWYRFDGVESAISDAGNCGVVNFTANNWSAPLDPATLVVTL